jgi:hypothetical protein
VHDADGCDERGVDHRPAQGAVVVIEDGLGSDQADREVLHEHERDAGEVRRQVLVEADDGEDEEEVGVPPRRDRLRGAR